MQYLQAIILGALEGLTEFLPVSSTAHLIWGVKLLSLPNSEFWKSFEIFIQLGAVLAVFIFYFKKIWQLENIKKLFVAFLPTAIIGYLLYGIIKNVFFDSYLIIAWALLIGGVIMLIFESKHQAKEKEITLTKAFLIGVFQALAVIPGVSRSAATIIGGLSLGIGRKDIVEFSFLLAVPTIVAASLFDLKSTGFHFSSNEFIILTIGLVVSFIVAWLVIKAFLKYIQKYDFKPFAWYRIAIGLIFLLILNL